jgi:hypothetical protein
VNFRVWGDEWESGLARLQATLMAPGTIRRAWGHPVHVRGDVRLDGNIAVLRAIDIPPNQWVELRALVPRSAFTSTAGMRVASGNGFARIVREEVSSAQAAERDREKIDDAVDHLPRTLLLLALLGLVPATALVYGVYRFYGRELDVGYDREYEQEPPSELDPGARSVARRAAHARRLERVHRDALRPHPARALQGRGRHDRAVDVGRHALRAGRGPRAHARRRRGADGVRAGGRGRRRRRALDGPRAPVALPRPHRGRSREQLEALQGVQGRGRRGGRTAATGSRTSG